MRQPNQLNPARHEDDTDKPDGLSFHIGRIGRGVLIGRTEAVGLVASQKEWSRFVRHDVYLKRLPPGKVGYGLGR